MSLLMAVHGGAHPDHFAQALASVFSNSRKPDEFLLVVDGPMPEILEAKVDEARALGARVISLQENQGLAVALNAGLKEAMFPWVVRADADDINLTNRFEALARAVEDDDVDIVGSAILELDAMGRPTGARMLPEGHADILAFARRRNPFNHMSVIFRRDLARACGGYPLIYGREDYGLWGRMIGRGARCRNLPALLVHARAGLGMHSRRFGLKNAMAESSLQSLLVRSGVKRPHRAFFDGLMRGVVLLLPPVLLGLIYRLLLRSPIPAETKFDRT